MRLGQWVAWPGLAFDEDCGHLELPGLASGQRQALNP